MLFLNCHPVIYILLSKLFNLLLKYGFVPEAFGLSYTVHLPKCNSVTKVMSTDDFRGISVSPVASIFFENCILNRYRNFLLLPIASLGSKTKLIVRMQFILYTVLSKAILILGQSINQSICKCQHSAYVYWT